ncbi:hypothetical protein DUNSADRAFT_1542 [Dunaliella salina]|uniref:Encoded protein n=1 Tax=Dunaliella salina TaxID=3046 RepID=A0ABQ7FXC1_DUNSA|nr:hypothetical protein DUNSADRAFT_1542 [Dunaliella salina]|eukprot:KAF5827000.1 hypothetical protein DUNSADRAFT_1542 [Dunaliella salina]
MPGSSSHAPYTSSHEDSAAAAAAAVLAAAVVGSPRSDSPNLLHQSPSSSNSLAATLHGPEPISYSPQPRQQPLQVQQPQPHPLAAYIHQQQQQQQQYMGVRRPSPLSASALEAPTATTITPATAAGATSGNSKGTRLSRSSSEALARQSNAAHPPDTPTRSLAQGQEGPNQQSSSTAGKEGEVLVGPSPVCSISSGIAELAPPSAEKDASGEAESKQMGVVPSPFGEAVQELAGGNSAVAPPPPGADAMQGGQK